MEEKRIYAIVAATIQVPLYANTDRLGERSVLQPVGRQIAQACHVVSKVRHQTIGLPKVRHKMSIGLPIGLPKVRHKMSIGLPIGRSVREAFQPLTTIILQARDSAELDHVYHLLACEGLSPVYFYDNNPEYGPGEHATAVGVICLPEQTLGTINYLPLWGSK